MYDSTTVGLEWSQFVTDNGKLLLETRKAEVFGAVNAARQGLQTPGRARQKGAYDNSPHQQPPATAALLFLAAAGKQSGCFHLIITQ